MPWRLRMLGALVAAVFLSMAVLNVSLSHRMVATPGPPVSLLPGADRPLGELMESVKKLEARVETLAARIETDTHSRDAMAAELRRLGLLVRGTGGDEAEGGGDEAESRLRGEKGLADVIGKKEEGKEKALSSSRVPPTAASTGTTGMAPLFVLKAFEVRGGE
jgi:hypothetical protein